MPKIVPANATQSAMPTIKTVVSTSGKGCSKLTSANNYNKNGGGINVLDKSTETKSVNVSTATENQVGIGVDAGSASPFSGSQ